MKEELRILEEHEQLIDTHMQWMQQSIKNIGVDFNNRKMSYITYEDVKNEFNDEFVLGIQAPTDTILKVPNLNKLNKENDDNINYEMLLKSNTGKIQVYMVQPLLAENYDCKIIEMKSDNNKRGIKRNFDDDENKDDAKPKRRVSR